MLFFGACFTENNVLRLGEQRRGENRTETAMQDDQPVNAKLPNWNLYRMSRMGQCESLSNDSSQVSVNPLEKNLQLLRQSKVYRL
jgi:hypothetical protein